MTEDGSERATKLHEWLEKGRVRYIADIDTYYVGREKFPVDLYSAFRSDHPSVDLIARLALALEAGQGDVSCTIRVKNPDDPSQFIDVHKLYGYGYPKDVR